MRKSVSGDARRGGRVRIVHSFMVRLADSAFDSPILLSE